MMERVPGSTHGQIVHNRAVHRPGDKKMALEESYRSGREVV